MYLHLHLVGQELELIIPTLAEEIIQVDQVHIQIIKIPILLRLEITVIQSPGLQKASVVEQHLIS